jgi:cation-transporting ATPase E
LRSHSSRWISKAPSPSEDVSADSRLVSAFNIGIPAFLLALEPNEKKQQGRFIRNTLVRSIPAALTSFLSIAVLVRLAPAWNIPGDEVGTACTYLLSLVGFLILINISRPLNKYRVGVIVLSIAGFGVCAMQFNWFFEMIRVSGHTALVCLLFAGVEILFMIGLTALLERIGKKKA